MEINYLKEFVTLAQTGNFLEAAELLYSSQSTLSKHVKKIESELGVLLFERTTRKVKISEYGELLLPYAKQIVELQNKYTSALERRLETEQNVLNLGTIPALAEYHITDVLINFKKSRAHATINVIQAGSTELKEMLRQGKCNLAFIRFTEEAEDDLVTLPYATDNMVAVLPATHQLAKRKTIPLRLLADENFVLSEKQTMLYRLSIQACEQSGFTPRVAYTDHKHENILDFVIKGLGVALMMKRLALYVASPKIAIVDISPQVTTQLRLSYLKGAKLSDAAEHFVQCAGGHC